MNTVYIHINEKLDPRQMEDIDAELRRLKHVTDVEFHTAQPHDVLVEYQPHSGMPMHILQKLSSLGLHADVMSC